MATWLTMILCFCAISGKNKCRVKAAVIEYMKKKDYIYNRIFKKYL